MKIAMVFDGLGFGGIERVGINYAKLLWENENFYGYFYKKSHGLQELGVFVRLDVIPFF